MNELRQDETLLIGSRNAIETLEQKDKARVLVASDSHGADAVVTSILREQGPQSDALVFCGDGIGDLCRILSQTFENPILAALLPPVIAMVEGNCEANSYNVALPGNTQLTIPLIQTISICGHKIFLTHGHRFSLYNGTDVLLQEAQRHEAEAVLYGHTHIATAQNHGALLALNPGSCTNPRAGQPPSYAVLQVSKGSPITEYTFYKITGNESVPFVPEPLMFF